MSVDRAMRKFRFLGVLALFLAGLALAPRAQHDFAKAPSGDAAAPATRERTPWPPEVLEAIEALPVQDEGRIKPFLAFAKQKLLRISGRSSVRYAQAGRDALPATAWMLDVLFRPETSFDDPVFLVPSREVLDAIGAAHEGRKMRDRYAYRDLVGARRKLFELTDRYFQESNGKPGTLPLVKGQIYALGNDVFLFEQLGGALGPLRRTYPADGDELQKLLGGAKAGPAAIVRHGKELNARLAKELDAVSENESTPLRRLILEVLNGRNKSASAWIFLPPADDAAEDWLAPAPLFAEALRGDEFAVAQAPVFEVLEKFAAGPEAIAVADVERLREHVTRAAEKRGEVGAVPYELHLERFGYLHWVRGLFLILLLLVAFLWWKPQAKLYGRIVYLLTLATTLVLTLMIVLRCMIRYHDPSTDIVAPVTNLYETIPFITVIGAFVLLFIEFFSKSRLALTVAIALGCAGTQLTLSYAPLDGGDTLTPLQAVLNSNFWLLTHVQSVTVGYAASLLAAILAHVWLVARLVLHLRGVKAAGASPFLKSTMRMCYGAVAFGLVFSVVGTILGGIWANDSWGRFWGWDPKENGALMICLWQIVMLHSRLAGFVKPFGFSVLALILGMITAFSWWHTNQLGVGLHSYGFTDGVLASLWTYYFLELALIAVALLCWWYAAMMRSAEKRVREELESQGGEASPQVQAPIED